MKKWVALFKSMRKWPRALLFMGCFILICVMVLGALVSTELGGRLLVKSVASIGKVSLGEQKGNLLTGLSFSHLHYEHESLKIDAENIHLRWRLLSLLNHNLSVQFITADKVRIDFPESSSVPDNNPYVWPDFSQMLSIDIEKVQFHHIEITQAASRIHLNLIEGAVNIGATNAHIKNLKVANDHVETLTDGTIDLRYPYELNIKNSWQVKHNHISYKGMIALDGNIKKMTLAQTFQEPFLATFKGALKPALHDKKSIPHADMMIDLHEQTLSPELVSLLLSKPLNVTSSLVTSGQMSLSGWLQKMHIKGQLYATTSETEYTIGLDSQVTINQQPQAESLLNLKLNHAHLSTRSRISDHPAAENTIKVQGNISALPSVKWDLSVTAEHINMAHVNTQWQSDIATQFITKGNFVAQKNNQPQWMLSVDNINLHGTLRGLPVFAQGGFDAGNGYWRSNNINLAVGANKLQASGSIGEQIAMRWAINAPIMNQLDPQLKGNIVSSGVIDGDLNNPTLNISAHVRQLVWRDYVIDQLTLALKPSLNNHYELVLDAQHLQWQKQRLSQFFMKGAGSLEQHNLSGKIQSPVYGSAEFNLNSSWKDDRWYGQWRDLKIMAKKIPQWNLSANSPMHADKTQFTMDKLCLTSATDVNANIQSILTPNALPHSGNMNQFIKKIIDPRTAMSKRAEQEVPTLCGKLQWKNTKTLLADMQLKALPLRHVRAWFKPEVTLAGVVEGQFSISAPSEQPAKITGYLQTQQAEFIYQFQGGKTEVYPLHTAKIDVTLDHNILATHLVMDWGKYGDLVADTKYAVVTKKIQGNIKAALTNLAPLESVMPYLHDVSGSATANVNLAGTIDQPDINGNISLTNGAATLPALGLELTDIQLQAASQSTGGMKVEGQIISGDGKLMLQGSLDNLGASDWQWKSNVFGANIRIIQQAQLAATISPNLKIDANAQAIRITGSTEIPWARGAFKTLPESATKVSSDVILVEGKTAQSLTLSQKNNIPILSNVILYFGDDVRFSGFGLDSQLSGKIHVLKEENRQTLTTGFVAVSQGKYKAYGQELAIERGRLIFQGAYDNPGLDIRALRVTDTVTAGLDIGGTLQNPKSRVFAIPAKTDSEAMAILLTGKSLTQSSAADAYALMSAISSLGMEKGQMMTADIQKFFRIDEVEIKSGKSLEQSSLWIGKYLTPKLLIRYVVGLFDQAFGIGIRYQLSEKLRIEATSGKTQSVDVIYKIER